MKIAFVRNYNGEVFVRVSDLIAYIRESQLELSRKDSLDKERKNIILATYDILIEDLQTF